MKVITISKRGYDEQAKELSIYQYNGVCSLEMIQLAGNIAHCLLASGYDFKEVSVEDMEDVENYPKLLVSVH